MLTATELTVRGREASTAGRHALAVSLLTRAVDRATSIDERATALQSLAHATAERGSPAEGITLCRQALALDGVSEGVQGLVHSQLGLLQMRAGRSVEALAEFGTAYPLLRGDDDLLGRLHLNRGNIHLHRHDTVQAAADFTEARARSTSPVERGMATHNLGYVELLRGDLVAALRYMEEAAPVLEPLSAVTSAVCAADRAEVLAAAGMPLAAARLIDGATATYARRRLRQFQGEALVVRARALLLVRPGEAASSARRAARVLRGRGNEMWALRAEALTFAADVRRRLESTRPPTRSWWLTLGDHAAVLDERLASHDLEAERVEVALHLALAGVRVPGPGRVAVPRVRRGVEEPLGTRLLRAEVRARSAARRGRRADALGRVRSGLIELHSWQSSYGSLDLQSSLVGHGRSLARFGLDQAVEDGRVEVVHEWSERARALVARVPPVRPPADAAAAERLATLRTLPTDAPAEDRDRLREQVREDSWFRPGPGTVLEPLGLAQVQHRVGDDVLVSYLVAHGVLHALVVSRGGPRLVRLAPLSQVNDLLPGLVADLDVVAADGLPLALRQEVRRSLEERLRTLAGLLVQPLVAQLGDSRLVVVPCGRLAAVPWAMLPGLVGRPLTVARSASMWAQSGPQPTHGRAGFVAGPRVARGLAEVGECASAWGDRVRCLSGTDAVAPAVARLTAEVDVLHVAAHGRHAAEQPLFSGIELADGIWFGYDVELLPRLPPLVVLSACELGRSSVWWAEELVGMTVAWLHAGTRCVVAAPAAVNDDLAAATLPAFHRGVAIGRAPAEVLAELAPAEGLPLTCFGAGW